ncbi:MAG: hypothetical protein E5W74_26735 [Mesorhizobium sp.]|uniref:hypothetical protein n=1 Tax=Mesorhizobium sp. TaxID=1871066 RepID=UPI0012166AA5|nr:hypothetical protein [Mesorhizobium sp.]TIT07322.1 MAG: hypothetical protein E5W74_26735 [Mesorhizobium sp.]
MRRERFSKQDVETLRQMLEQDGFKEPSHGWIDVRLQDIAFKFEDDLDRRDTETVASRVASALSEVEGINSTINFLERWEQHLTAERISNEAPFVYGAWDEPRHEPTDEELAAHTLPSEFTPDEIGTTRRVLKELRMYAGSVLGHHMTNRAMRPIGNEHPEIDGLVRGLARLWCAAFKIPVAKIKISESAGSPTARFIEAGVEILLGKALSRKAIVTRVCTYRDEEKSKLS